MSFKMNPNFKRDLQESVNKQVTFPELMPPEFMQRYTNFKSIQHMIDQSPFSDVEQSHFPKILMSEEWNRYTRQNTKFQNWNEMLETAQKSL